MGSETELSSVTDRTTRLVTDILARHSKPIPFDVDDALVDVGLTSLDLVGLMIAVEAEFDITIPPEHLSLENFYSASAVASMVTSILSQADVLRVA